MMKTTIGALRVLLNESKVDDLIKKHPEHEGLIRDFSKRDPSGNNKYLAWMVRTRLKERVSNFSVINIIERYHNLQLQHGERLNLEDPSMTWGNVAAHVREVEKARHKTNAARSGKVTWDFDEDEDGFYTEMVLRKKVIGYIHTTRPIELGNMKISTLGGSYLEDPYRGRGLGTLLYTKAVQIAKAMGATHISNHSLIPGLVTSSEARDVYIRLEKAGVLGDREMLDYDEIPDERFSEEDQDLRDIWLFRIMV